MSSSAAFDFFSSTRGPAAGLAATARSYKGSPRAHIQGVRRTYALLVPIYGFREEIGCVVTIPAGAELDCIGDNQNGIGVAFWNGDRIMVFREDVVKNGLQVERAGATG
jgi:hypothetical protein